MGLALMVVLLKHLWYWAPFLAFTLLFLLIELVNVHQQYARVKKYDLR